MVDNRYVGFRSLVVFLFFACVVALQSGFLIRRKWRLAVARREEIKRLMAFAAEETARAEREASAEYAVCGAFCPVLVSSSCHHQCAVCYSFTTTRCSQCKAVWYCSGRYQIIHWRQGHRKDCHPPPPPSERLSDVGRKVSEQGSNELNGDNFKTKGGRRRTSKDLVVTCGRKKTETLESDAWSQA